MSRLVWPSAASVTTAVGGQRGGGTRITELGQVVLRSYRDLQLQLQHLLDEAHDAIAAGRIGKVTWAHGSYNRNARTCLFNEHQKIDPTAGPDKTGEDYIDWDMWLGHQWGLASKIACTASRRSPST